MVTVNVTQEDIDRGIPMASEACPIALAVLRLPNAKTVSVYNYITINGDSIDNPISIQTPEHVLSILKNYDKTGKMEPFTFEIEL